MTDDYSTLEGYNPERRPGPGLRPSTQFCPIKKGDVVIDLGSGAGNDAFIARAETGETGKVIGVDFTPAMIDRPARTLISLGFHNVDSARVILKKCQSQVTCRRRRLQLRPQSRPQQIMASSRKYTGVLNLARHFSHIPTSSRRLPCPLQIPASCRNVCRLCLRRHPETSLPGADPTSTVLKMSFCKKEKSDPNIPDDILSSTSSTEGDRGLPRLRHRHPQRHVYAEKPKVPPAAARAVVINQAKRLSRPGSRYYGKPITLTPIKKADKSIP